MKPRESARNTSVAHRIRFAICGLGKFGGLRDVATPRISNCYSCTKGRKKYAGIFQVACTTGA